MSRPESRLISGALLTRLAAFTVYRGEIRNPDGTTHPPALAGDPDGRVGPYVLLYPFGPKDGPDENLGDTITDLTYTGQLTCVAGYVEDCEFLVTQVDGLVNRWIPALAGVAFGAFRPPPGFDPGPVQRDPDVLPPRFFVPLQYQTTATT